MVIEYQEGPLPSPDSLAKYEAICPGAADRILTMAERQSIHRHSMEGTVIPAAVDAERRGQRNGLIVALAAISGSVVLGISGATSAAALMGSTTVVSLAAVFVTGRRAQAKERSAARR